MTAPPRATAPGPPVRAPLVTGAAGCTGTGRELARFGDLRALDGVVVGPVGLGGGSTVPVRMAPSPCGLVVGPAPVLPVEQVATELLPWFAARAVRVRVTVRGGTAGAVADVADRLRRSLDAGVVEAVEVDLTARRDSGRPPVAGVPQEEPWTPHSADPQDCLRMLARVRERLPRDVVLVARVGLESPDPVAAARAAVGGGASVVLVSGAVPAAPRGSWLVGPAVLPATLGLVARMREAVTTGRLPDVPVLAVGGVHDLVSAQALLTAGAAGVQVGSAALADPTLLWRLPAALRSPEAPLEPLAEPQFDPHVESPAEHVGATPRSVWP